MKKLTFLLATYAIIVLISSCKKSVLDSVPPPCNIVCNNGGVVTQNCGCICPTGFTGTNCGTALPLKSVTITKIVVNNFPTTKRIGQIGYYWDDSTIPSAYPDIYINLNIGTTSTNTQSSTIFTNVNSVPQTYTVGPFTLPNPSSNYSISLYDYDGTSDPADFMGGIYFRPADFKSGYPQKITLENSAGTIKYAVYVTWNF